VADNADIPSIALCAQTACIWEATARKPGNVHRYRDFDDTSYVDFLLSAAAIAPALEDAATRPLGATILAAVQATRRVVRGNTNLGIVLLLAPFAMVPRQTPLAEGVAPVLNRTTVDDARATYEAIRLVSPGGLGQAPEQDVREEPTATLTQVMALAADRDLVARQYANGFREVLKGGLNALQRGMHACDSLEDAIIMVHLQLLALLPDSLIVRKRGAAVAHTASKLSGEVLAAGWPSSQVSWDALADLDSWLRADGNARNPGTTADLVTATLFAALRDGMIRLPLVLPWSVR
jgi:triphosphoribosyl-dephospho-CoA synthase